MRPRTKITIPNPSKSEIENFDRFVRIVLAKGKPAKKATQGGKRISPKLDPKK